MATIKQRRITKIVREFVKTQDSYDITGVDLALSKFFYRASQELFQDLSTGDYRVDTSAGKQTLVITNQEILSAAEAFQVGYVLDFTATKYETQWNVDINTLKDRYNQLVDSTQELWEYIRKTGFISDDTTIDLILPQLDINEVWVRGEDGYVGMPINDIQTSIKDAIQKYLLEVVYPTIDGYVEATSKPALDEYVETTIKPDIDDFTDAKEVELQDLKDILANQLQELVDNALADRGVIPNGTDWNTLSYGTWYVSDLNGSNYTNHPNLEDAEGVGVVLVTDSQGGNAKVIRYYSMQKKMHFKIKNATGVWSEWSTLSAGGGVRYEYTQANHGFLFTPVMLDGISGEWVRATTNGADGIAVYISRDRFELIMNGSVQIPNSAKDVNGDVFVNDEYYFLSNNIAGGLDREKPTGIFQPMIRTYLDEQGRMWAEVEVDTPVDLVPRVLNEEAEALGIQMQVDNRLQTESKIVVEAINELNDRVGIENTIADLVASKKYEVGDVVQVLGYYSVWDGAGHLRQKKPVGYTGSDAVIGVDGSVWGIVHNGEVNVSWFGAKGDGITNDTEAIQKTVASRLNVVFKTGVYFINSEINLDGIRDVEINGNTSTLLLGSSGRIKNTYSTVENESIAIKSVKIHSFVIKSDEEVHPYEMVYFSQLYDSVIENNTFICKKGSSLRIGCYSSNNKIQNNYFISDKQSDPTETEATQLSITGINHNADCGVLPNENTGIMGEFIRGYAEPNNNIITKNTLIGGSHGIRTWCINNNTISNNYLDGHSHRNISLTGSIENLIYGNICKNAFSSGIHLYAGSSKNKISNNKINNIDATGGLEGSLQMYVQCSHNIVSGNTVESKSNYAMYIAVDCNYNMIDSNTFTGDYKQACVALESNWLKKSLINGFLKYSRPNTPYTIACAIGDMVGNIISNNNITKYEKNILDVTALYVSSIGNKNSVEIKLNTINMLNRVNCLYVAKNNITDNMQITFISNNLSCRVSDISHNLTSIDYVHHCANNYADKTFKSTADNIPNCFFCDTILINSDTVNDLIGVDREIELVCTNSNGFSLSPSSKFRISSVFTPTNINLNSIILGVTGSAFYEKSRSVNRVNLTYALPEIDTPYHATQMSKLGILDSYHNYLTELHEYEKSQNVQSDSEIMNLNILQPPVIPKEIEEYAKEYNLI